MNKREKYEPKTSSVNISSCFTNQIREVFWNVQNLFWFEAHLRKYVIRTIFRFGNMRVFFGVVNSLCLMVTSWRQYVFLIPRRRSLQAPPPPHSFSPHLLWHSMGCLRMFAEDQVAAGNTSAFAFPRWQSETWCTSTKGVPRGLFLKALVNCRAR